ncbi:MAG: terminase large subunit [Oscillospiraceae bacterium]|nr:terminase large subunit [Oscillospiraceae bacterium]
MMTGCRYIDDYIAALRSGQRPASKDMLLACDLVERKLSEPDVIVDVQKTERAKELIEKYFEFSLMDWELFILALIHCYYPDDTLVFTEYLILMGRGCGKNGFISGLCWYLTTPDHGVRGYNVDIIANSEDQAKVSFDDVYGMLERHWRKLVRWFYRSKVLIRCLKTDSYIVFNTANARTKDGKRSACLVFDEEHEYESDDALRVFRSGFGKRRHSRVFKITTNGYVRGGVLDKDLDKAASILKGEFPASRTCPLLYRADSEEDVKHPAMWVKACPSLPYMDTLRIQMEQDFIEMKMDKSIELDFYTKRMNLPRSNMEIAVTQWDNIAATKQEFPEDMLGWQCTVGIDYGSMRDWASVNAHFKRGDMRLDISKSWICTQNPDLFRIKAPWQEWSEVVPVDDVEIAPELIAEYIVSVAQKYQVVGLAMDHFRFALMRKALEAVGFDVSDRKNIRLVRPSDIMRVQPVIASCFNRHLFVWGNTPSLRWATNNTKLVRSGVRKRSDSDGESTDTGNYYYAKIEGKSRKTDPFMALVASMVIEDKIQEPIQDGFLDMSVIS